MANEVDLENSYFDPKHPGSFGGSDRLAKETNVSRKAAKHFLQTQDTYTRNKNVRHKFRRRKIVVPSIDYLWQADLITVINFSRKNKGVKYLLTVIDALSRFAFVRALKNKTARVVTEAFNDIFVSSGRKCKYLQTDHGTEFYNAKFKELMKINSIVLFSNHSELKASMVERFNRTLMMRLNKYFTYTKNTIYIDQLQSFIDSYNSTIHRSIKTRPKDVNEFNQFDAWLCSNSDLIKSNQSKIKFKVGEFVRIKIQKPTFAKGYSCTYSEEIYKIREIVNSKPITYKISDNTDENILGIFYPEELTLVKL
jgi:transposase InsO family protein